MSHPKPQYNSHSEPKSVRRVYTEEFKRDAVRLIEERGNLRQVSRDLGICETVLGRWKNQLGSHPDRPFPGHGNPQNLELAQALRQNARLREENDILKKAVGIFTANQL